MSGIVENSIEGVKNNPGLAALDGEVQEVDLQIAPQVSDLNPPLDIEAEPKVDRIAEAKALIAILKTLVMMAFPVVKDAPQSEFDALIQPSADCLDYYNVDVSKLLAHPLAALAFAGVPLVLRGVTNWQASHKKKPDAPGVETDKPQIMPVQMPGTTERA